MCVQELDLGSDPVSLLLSLRHAHKNTVMEVKWNLNGNWLLTASRDHLCKLFDIRNLKEELQVFRGHKKEATGEGERREFLSWSSAPAPAERGFFCPQLWPGILSTKACLLAEVLMALCSSGTLGNGCSRTVPPALLLVFFLQCSRLCFAGWRRRLEGWKWLMKG